ncbi:MAG: DUF4258 domain-containing protein [Alphaproteobacteria bacterium]|nr:DUF4258 domain-containing protein [Alphaproteobacteria bacterium]
MAARRLVLTKHAQDMLDEREIPFNWIERVLDAPVFEEPDTTHIGAIRAFAPIVEFGNRMLRVVYYDSEAAIRVITLHFDRGATRRSRRP